MGSGAPSTNLRLLTCERLNIVSLSSDFDFQASTGPTTRLNGFAFVTSNWSPPVPTSFRTPRLSIIVPFQQDQAAFEETLLSILENRPDDCQVVAAHNGAYQDPFDLGDEVEFVVARSSRLTDLVRDAFDHTTAPLVHVIGTGCTATENWLDSAVRRMEKKQVAAVAATVVKRDSGQVLSRGWTDTPGRLCQPAMLPGKLSRRGFFLNACLIRRSLLGNLLDAVAPAIDDPITVSYAFGCLLASNGWRVESEDSFRVKLSDQPRFPEETAGLSTDLTSQDRGQVLAAVHARVLGSDASVSLLSMLSEALLGHSSIGEMWGTMRYQAQLPAMRRAIDTLSVTHVDQAAKVLAMAIHSETAQRRAA